MTNFHHLIDHSRDYANMFKVQTIIELVQGLGFCLEHQLGYGGSLKAYCSSLVLDMCKSCPTFVNTMSHVH